MHPFIDAPHGCIAKPDLHATTFARGIYDIDKQYKTWLSENSAARETTLATSVKHVEHFIKYHSTATRDAIGGICQGSSVAGCIAARNAQFAFYLNFCGPPLYKELFEKELFTELELPSLHVLGDNDELLTRAELYDLPARCRFATTCRHSGGHVVPMLHGPLKFRVLEFMRSKVGIAATTAELSLQGLPARDPMISTVSEDSEPEPSFDSMQLLQQKRAGDARMYATWHLYAVAAVLVIFHHSVDRGGLVKADGLPQIDTSPIVGLQTETMVIFGTLAGIWDREQPVTLHRLLRELWLNGMILFATHFSILPEMFAAFHSALAPTASFLGLLNLHVLEQRFPQIRLSPALGRQHGGV